MSESNTSDTDGSEQLDGDVLGEDVGDDGLPGIGDYPPDQALGVNDPNLVADDDVAMREARHRSEEGAGDDQDRPLDLLPPDADDDLLDAEQQAIATDAADDDADRIDPPAEIAAIHERRDL
jgi:hypothetical protein